MSIAKGHKLRAAIHAWLKENPRAPMVEIVAAFGNHSRTNVRHNVILLCKDRLIVMHGSQGANSCTYSAIGEFDSVQPLSRKELIAESKREDERVLKGMREQVTGGRTVYNSGDNPAIAQYRSGGQGALVKAEIGSGMYGGTW